MQSLKELGMTDQMFENMSEWKDVNVVGKDAWIVGFKHFDTEQRILISKDPPHKLTRTQRQAFCSICAADIKEM